MWTYVWNEAQQVPYAYSNETLTMSAAPIEWVGFDDVRSVAIKTNHAIKYNLAGVMIWSLDGVNISYQINLDIFYFYTWNY